MAVIVKTGSPNELLAKIYKAIDNKKIETWSYDKDGDFTHTAPQWKNLAWLKPRIGEGELRFTTIAPTNKKISTEAYAIYHGRYIEMLLSHFDADFSNALATSMPTTEDKVS